MAAVQECYTSRPSRKAGAMTSQCVFGAGQEHESRGSAGGLPDEGDSVP
jgi:hypothetical protein